MITFVLAVLADIAAPGSGWPVLWALIAFQALGGDL